MPLHMIRGDIAAQRADALVIDVTALRGPGEALGVRVFGDRTQVLEPTRGQLTDLAAGEVTSLSARERPVLHVTAPIWKGGGQGEAEQMKAAYRNAVERAYANGHRSLAVALLTGSDGSFPPDEAFSAAVEALGACALQYEDAEISLITPPEQPLSLPPEQQQRLNEYMRQCLETPEAAPRRITIRPAGLKARWKAFWRRLWRRLTCRRDRRAAMRTHGMAAIPQPLMPSLPPGGGEGPRTPGGAPGIPGAHTHAHPPHGRREPIPASAPRMPRAALPSQGREEPSVLEHADSMPVTPGENGAPSAPGMSEAENRLRRRIGERGGLPSQAERERAAVEQLARSRYGYQRPPETRLVLKGQPTEEQTELDRRISDQLAHRDDTFAQAVLHWIDRRGYTDADTYKRANLDRKVFSKLRSNIDYRPSKDTAVALCVGLRLNLDEAIDLLARAGYSLGRSLPADIIIRCCIEDGADIFKLMARLHAHNLPCLGA